MFIFCTCQRAWWMFPCRNLLWSHHPQVPGPQLEYCCVVGKYLSYTRKTGRCHPYQDVCVCVPAPAPWEFHLGALITFSVLRVTPNHGRAPGAQCLASALHPAKNQKQLPTYWSSNWVKCLKTAGMKQGCGQSILASAPTTVLKFWPCLLGQALCSGCPVSGVIIFSPPVAQN